MLFFLNFFFAFSLYISVARHLWTYIKAVSDLQGSSPVIAASVVKFGVFSWTQEPWPCSRNVVRFSWRCGLNTFQAISVCVLFYFFFTRSLFQFFLKELWLSVENAWFISLVMLYNFGLLKYISYGWICFYDSGIHSCHFYSIKTTEFFTVYL